MFGEPELVPNDQTASTGGSMIARMPTSEAYEFQVAVANAIGTLFLRMLTEHGLTADSVHGLRTKISPTDGKFLQIEVWVIPKTGPEFGDEMLCENDG